MNGVMEDNETYAALRKLVLSGELDSAAKATESSVARRLGVSRTPVRDALARLEWEGLVERGPHGVRNRVRSPEEVLELYEVRIPLEAAVARASAIRRDEFDLRRLDRLCEDSTEGLDGDGVTRARRAELFHEILWHACRNSALESVTAQVAAQLRGHHEVTVMFPGRWERILSEHRAIVEAVEQRDADGAAELARQHTTEARDVRLQTFAAELLTAANPSSIAEQPRGAGHVQ